MKKWLTEVYWDWYTDTNHQKFQLFGDFLESDFQYLIINVQKLNTMTIVHGISIKYKLLKFLWNIIKGSGNHILFYIF